MLIIVITITMFVGMIGIHSGTVRKFRMEQFELSIASEILLGLLFPMVLISSTGDFIGMVFNKNKKPFRGYAPIKKYPITVGCFIELVKVEIDNYKYEGFSSGLKMKNGEVHLKLIFIIESAIRDLDYKIFE